MRAENYGPVASLASLRCIEAMRPKVRDDLQEKQKCVEHCVRRALEVAALSADMESGNAKQADAISDWRELERRASKASDRLGELLDWISRDNQTREPTLSRVLAQTRLGRVDVKPPRRRSDSPPTPEQKDAKTILRAAKTLQLLAEDAKRRQAAFAANRQNPGEPAKRAFVLELARVWV